MLDLIKGPYEREVFHTTSANNVAMTRITHVWSSVIFFSELFSGGSSLFFFFFCLLSFLSSFLLSLLSFMVLFCFFEDIYNRYPERNSRAGEPNKQKRRIGARNGTMQMGRWCMVFLVF